MMLWTWLKKEWIEQWRTGRILIFFLLFCAIGIASPAFAYWTPWLMEMMARELAESGLTIHHIEVNSAMAWQQYVKNLKLAYLAMMILFSGIVSVEVERETLLIFLAKGLPRPVIIGAKILMMATIWTIGVLLSATITYGYSLYFWPGDVVDHLAFVLLCLYIFGLWLISVTLLFSVLLPSPLLAILASGLIWLGAFAFGYLPLFHGRLPAHLLSVSNILLKNDLPADYFQGLASALFFALFHLFLAFCYWQRKRF